MPQILGYALYSATLLASAAAAAAAAAGKDIYETISHQHELRNLQGRQATPVTMTSTNCPENDGLFYETTHNYTYQIQCATTYTGEQIMTQTALGFTACILQCASYNHNNSTSSSFCVGVNFNAETDGSNGDCTLYDEVDPVPNQASEEGSIEDAALLIFGPTGQVYATPEMQPSDVVGDILTNSFVFTSQAVLPPSSVPIAVSTAFVTSVTTVISCAPDISNCPADGVSTSTFPFTASALLTPTTQSILISLGGMRPLTTSVPISGGGTTPIATAASYSPPYVTLQATQTSKVPFTEYHVTIVVSCTQEPNTSRCTTSPSTQTITGLRTEISCSPGTCSGVMLATGTFADMPGVFTGGCMVDSV